MSSRKSKSILIAQLWIYEFIEVLLTEQLIDDEEGKETHAYLGLLETRSRWPLGCSMNSVAGWT